VKLSAYRILEEVGSGKDGIALLAECTSESNPVEVRVLKAAATDADQWKLLSRRLPQSLLLTHPAALKVISLQLNQDPPFIVLEPWKSPRPDSWQFQTALSTDELIDLAQLLADALACAHRIGLAHGNLFPEYLGGLSPREVKLDFTGLACHSNSVSVAAPNATQKELLAGPAAFQDDCCRLGVLLQSFLDRSSAVTRREDESKQLSDLNGLIALMMSPDPEDRPTLRQVHDQLAILRQRFPFGTRPKSVSRPLDEVSATLNQSIENIAAPAAPSVTRIGRFQLLEKLGQGNMGTVYRAQDTSDNAIVAIKVIRSDFMSKPSALRRFHKEARLHSLVNNPYVANLLEVNEDGGVHYLVMEFVPGRNLGSAIREHGPMREGAALHVIAGVARALADAHDLGIVHRDIKPDNILILEESIAGGESCWQSAQSIAANAGARPRVKLADFGLARHIEQSESLDITVPGGVVGTPFYMAPDSSLTSRSDIYSIGATLFHLLAGRPPFIGDSIAQVIGMHCNEPPPSLKRLNPRLSDATCELVSRMLDKSPDARHANAGELLEDVERILRGEPTSITAHPAAPECDPRRVLSYEWAWELDSSPEQLWPLISNTDRFNRAIGLPAVNYSMDGREEGGVRRFGHFLNSGIVAEWEEHPFEWIEGRRMGILREYSRGILKWMTSVVELTPRPQGGTRLSHKVRVEPSGFVGRLAAAFEIGVKARRAVERVYARIDAALSGRLGNPAKVDAFEPAERIGSSRRNRLEMLLDQLSHCGLDPQVVLKLGEYLVDASAQELVRIRPLEFARRFSLDADQTVSAFLHASHLGLLVLQWDILCLRCRISCSLQETIRAIRDHANCTACNADFELDFANSVEMVFRIHPQIREAEIGSYCIGGPAHSPHVAAQIRIAPGERFELALALAEGNYRIRGPQLVYSIDFQVRADALVSRQELELGKQPDPDSGRKLRAGTQVLVLNNPNAYELIVRVERTLPANILTAARATALPLFRSLFPGEILSPGQLISVATLTFVATALEDVEQLYRDQGDARTVATIHEHFRLLEEFTRREGGALVKTVHNGMLVAFHDAAAALQSALSMQGVLSEQSTMRDLRLRIAVHRGPTVAATLNGQLDYFGQTVNEVLRLAQQSHAGAVLITQPVIADPQAATLLQTCSVETFASDENAGFTSANILRLVRRDRNLAKRPETIEPVSRVGI